MKANDDLDELNGTERASPSQSATGKWMSHYQSQVLPDILEDLALGRHVCLLGPKGSGNRI